MVSSTYLFKYAINFSSYAMIVYSKWTIKIPSKTGPRGDPIAIYFAGEYFFEKWNQVSRYPAITIFVYTSYWSEFKFLYCHKFIAL